MKNHDPKLSDYQAALRVHFSDLQARYGVTSLGVFGSRARGEERTDSDLDLLAEFTETPSLLKLIEGKRAQRSARRACRSRPAANDAPGGSQQHALRTSTVMTSRRPTVDSLRDIEREAAKAVSFLGSLSVSEFAADAKTFYAVMHALEVVGEAARNVPPEVRSRFPHVPWRAMTGIRDKLIHDDFNASPEIVWKTVNEDLPALLQDIGRIITELEPDA